MESQIHVRLCESADTSRVRNFLSRASFFHRHLDWREPLDWVNKRSFYLALNEIDELQGAFCSSPEIKNFFWIRLFACSNKNNLFKTWHALFDSFLDANNLTKNSPLLFTLAYYPWMMQLLELEGGKLIDRIVQLESSALLKTDSQNYFSTKSIHKMKRADLKDVFEIDRSRFPPIWQQSFKTLSLSFKQVNYSTVFRNKNRIIGFQMSTISTNRAHLARIAVDQDFSRMGIGTALIQDLLTHCHQLNIRKISVNTQETNKNSITLYKKMGFKDIGNSYPIYQLDG